MFAPSIKQNTVSSGNETLDKFLGGGLINSSLNLFERHGPSSRILDAIINKSFAATALTNGDAVIYVNFNTSLTLREDEVISGLPAPKKVKSELMYRDHIGRSTATKIKIAWRYSQPSSPADSIARMDQIDFGVALNKSREPDELGQLRVVNLREEDSIGQILSSLIQAVADVKKSQSHPAVIVIIKDLIHPFSPLVDDDCLFKQFLYGLRCFSRTLDRGCIFACYDSSFCKNHSNIEQQIYNLADCVVSFYSYETDENIQTGYKDIDGTLNYIKVPKINSFGFHFQQDLSDWGYRLTKNLRYFVVDELSLPPCDDDNEEGKGKQNASDLIKIDSVRQPLQQVGPLEEFRDVAKDVLPRRL